jgi:hypothetical protein
MRSKLKIENWEIEKSEGDPATGMSDFSIFNFQFSIPSTETGA